MFIYVRKGVRLYANVLQVRSAVMLVGLRTCEVLAVLRCVSGVRDLPSSRAAVPAHPGNAQFRLHCQQLIYMSDDSVF
jgi:hypothetical protein